MNGKVHKREPGMWGRQRKRVWRSGLNRDFFSGKSQSLFLVCIPNKPTRNPETQDHWFCQGRGLGFTFTAIADGLKREKHAQAEDHTNRKEIDLNQCPTKWFPTKQQRKQEPSWFKCQPACCSGTQRTVRWYRNLYNDPLSPTPVESGFHLCS